MPEYPLDPRLEMSEAEYMGYLQDTFEPADCQGPIPEALAEAMSPGAEMFATASMERMLRARGYRVIQSPADTVGTPIEVKSDSFVEMYRELYGDKILGTGFALLKRLRGDVWRTQEGQELTAAQMTPGHASNLVHWLERRARVVLIMAQLEANCAAIDHDGGEMAHEAIESEVTRLYDIDPVDYLRETRLYKAIAARAAEAVPLRG